MLVLAACLMASLGTEAQTENGLRHFDIAVAYNPMLANVTTGNEFWMQGFTTQFHAGLWHNLGPMADVTYLHTGNMHTSGVGLDLLAATFGPSYSWSPSKHGVAVFGQALVGTVHGSNSTFPSSTGVNTTGNSLALELGGGVDVPTGRHLYIRAVEADWLRTQLPNATTNVQNNLRLGFGLKYRF
jgi:hypothetical protein